jgi:hypothetical protein
MGNGQPLQTLEHEHDLLEAKLEGERSEPRWKLELGGQQQGATVMR